MLVFLLQLLFLPLSILENIYFFTLQIKHRLLRRSHYPPEHGHTSPHSLYAISMITVDAVGAPPYTLTDQLRVPWPGFNCQHLRFSARLLNPRHPSLRQAGQCLGMNARTPHPSSTQLMTDKVAVEDPSSLSRVGKTEARVLYRLPGVPSRARLQPGAAATSLGMHLSQAAFCPCLTFLHLLNQLLAVKSFLRVSF